MLTVGGLHHGLDVLLLQARNALSHLCGKSVLCEERKKNNDAKKNERKRERKKSVNPSIKKEKDKNEGKKTKRKKERRNAGWR